MKKPILFKILAGYLLIILATVSLILAFSFRSMKNDFLDTTTENLITYSIPLKLSVTPLLLDNSIKELDSIVKELGKLTPIRITIIDVQGTVLADSVEKPSSMEKHETRPEFIDALKGKTDHILRYSTTLKLDMLYVALPIENQGVTIGVLRLSLPYGRIDSLIRNQQKSILNIAFFISLLAVLIAIIFAHFLSRPIREMNNASKKVAAGDLSQRVNIRSNDELGELASSFNEMTSKLEASFTELSKTNTELESIISSMNEALFMLDNNGKILLHNNSALAMAHTKMIKGRYYWEVLRSEKINRLLGEPHTQPTSCEIEIDDKTYLLSLAPLPSREAILLLLHDISELKQIENIKRDLVVNVSHELRTPLTAIKGFTETLMEESDEKSLEFLSIINRHTDRLINIVNDLLDLSELEEPEAKLNIEKFDLQELIENIFTIFEPRAKKKGLNLSIDSQASPFYIKADPFRLEQLITNIIDNAVKYTETGEISVILEKADRLVSVTIKDTGIGILKEHLSRLFDRFYVVDKSRSRILGGTGLGLSIAKHIANLHDGDIKVESTPYKGTTFIISLPASPLS